MHFCPAIISTQICIQGLFYLLLICPTDLPKYQPFSPHRVALSPPQSILLALFFFLSFTALVLIVKQKPHKFLFDFLILRARDLQG